MNILFTLNKNYLTKMVTLIRSILDNNNDTFEFYIFSHDIKIEDIDIFQKYFNQNCHFHLIDVPTSFFENAPISARYPHEMYYRIFASKFLPEDLERILYLDPDIIVKGNLEHLYNLDFEGNYYVGACNIRGVLLKFNQIKNGASNKSQYINTGVLLINLSAMRKALDEQKIYRYIEERKQFFTLPDQDIISALFGEKIKLIDRMIYNLSDRSIGFYNRNLKNINHQVNEEWIEKNTIIIHYFGKNKPWKSNYKGILNKYYDKYKID